MHCKPNISRRSIRPAPNSTFRRLRRSASETTEAFHSHKVRLDRVCDLFVVDSRGGWHASYDGDPEESLNVAVTAGSTYHILVMSYVLPQDFELRTTLRDDSAHPRGS